MTRWLTWLIAITVVLALALRDPLLALVALLLGLLGRGLFLKPGLVVVLALACLELLFLLFILFLLVLDLTLRGALLEFAHAAAEAAGQLWDALRPEEQQDYD